ncbi:MAG TPA: electron transport complex subunit RsxG [Steroidobacter sp.]|jgi:electron transport complex protein RnfG|nr:electron transport complex subunit RsxG [Steroidobacter sp.]
MATPTEEFAGRPRRAIARSAAALAAIGAVLSLAAVVLAQVTRDRVARNERSWIKQPLYALLDPASYDNDPLADRIVIQSRDLLGVSIPATVYRARRRGAPVAAVIQSVAPEGYRGPIELLVAVRWDGALLGVQVLRHNETPGLGDAFETREAGWLQAFRGLSLSNPPQNRWTVRKEGGDFDAFTGATVTPRAIVKGVRRALEFYRADRDRLFAADAQ